MYFLLKMKSSPLQYILKHTWTIICWILKYIKDIGLIQQRSISYRSINSLMTAKKKFLSNKVVYDNVYLTWKNAINWKVINFVSYDNSNTIDAARYQFF